MNRQHKLLDLAFMSPLADAFALEYVRGQTKRRLGDAVAAASRESAR